MYFDENEPQSVRDARFAAERAERRAARRAARNSEPLDSRTAHLGAAITATALLLLTWFGRTVASAVVGGIFLLWFSAALARARADGDHGRHALQRAYNATFGWADSF
ncbi:hypothetical protein ACFVHW_05255 [Streptomyces sp. NPDC127110]|uniref:hypothetical protein n=1 Tax=Streptomyces sp. NPDC127110 TaxID=3345362 RepID=UPI00362AB86B